MTARDWEAQKDFFKAQYEINKILFGEEFARKIFELNKKIVEEGDE